TMYLGDASRASAVAVGDVYLDFGLDRFLVLKDCLYAPCFRKNLISFSKLFMNGFSATFDNKVIIRFSKMFICSGSLVDNLYILESKASPLQQKQLLNSSSNLSGIKLASRLRFSAASTFARVPSCRPRLPHLWRSAPRLVAKL
ncbi:Unknown protein, partial [Striga hermonthica]